LNSKQLHYFLAIVQNGSIAAAARELDIAQPAISQQLANLEREVRAQLFTRSFKGVSLTPAGELFAKHARKLTEDMNSAKADLKQLSLAKTGKIKLGMLPSIGNVLSMSLIAEVERWHPELELEISTGPSYSVKEWLRINQIDIALTYEQEIDCKFMHSIPLIKEYMYLIFSANNCSKHAESYLDRASIDFWELSQFELLTPSNKDALGRLIYQYEKQSGVALRHKRGYSGQLMTGFRQVMKEDCAMILPSAAIFHLEEMSLIKSLRIINPDMTRQAVIATNNTIALSDTKRWVIDVLKRVTASEQKLRHWRGDLSQT